MIVDVARVSDSCGFAVPVMELVGERDQLDRVNPRKGEAWLATYRRQKNAGSIDGLPAVDW